MGNLSLQNSAENWGDPFGEPEEIRLEDFDFAPLPEHLLPQTTPREAADQLRSQIITGMGTRLDIPLGANPWPAGLIFDLAIGLESTPVVLEHHGVSEGMYAQYLETPAFRRELVLTAKEVKEKGISFSCKAKFMAEDCLPDMYAIAKDSRTAAATRVAVFRDLTRLGDLEPNKGDKAGSSNTPQVNIQINL